jgi:MoaA/NifB/PqqE/SkfB family radical SAM enzyme
MCPLTLGATMSSRDPGHMTDATWAEVVTAAREIGRVNLTGYGEIALHPGFPSMLRKLDDAGVRTSFSTNGIAMNARRVAALAQLRHLECVNVSIDSPDPDVYHRIRGGDVGRALAGLSRLARALRPRTIVTASSVVMDENVESLAAFPDLLKRIGVDAWVLQGLHDRTATLDALDARRVDDGLAMVRSIERRCRALALEVRLEDGGYGFAAPVEAATVAFSEAATRQCVAPWTVPYVDRAGRVFPCCIADDTAVMGRLADAPLREIWRGEAFDRFRADLVGGTNLPPVCRACTAVQRIGPHPMRFDVTVTQAPIALRRGSRVRLAVVNAGIDAWTTQYPLAIGKLGDDASAFHHPTWASRSRIQYMSEAAVPPGETVTFEFDVGHPSRPVSEAFALVVEGVTWFDHTRFSLPLPRPRWPVLQRVAPIVRRMIRR